MDINAVIPYNWNLGWGKGCGKDGPKVNLLLKEIIERNVNEMERLFAAGASLKKTDETTRKRVMYHVVDSLPVMKCLMAHGMSRVGSDVDYDGDNGANDKRCLSPDGYRWGLIGRAYYLKAYDVMELLAQHGFDEFNCFDLGWEDTWEADYEILKSGDPKGLRILLENGYVIDGGPFYYRCYEKYVVNRPQVKRKTIGLDSCKFSAGLSSKPQYEKEPWLIGRKEAKARNARRLEDFRDRERAHRAFQEAYGIDKIRELRERKAEMDELLVKVMSNG